MSFPCGAHQATALLTATAASFHCYLFPLQFLLPLHFFLPPLLSTAAATWRTGGRDVIPLRSTSGHCAIYCNFYLLQLLLVSTAILAAAAFLSAAATFYRRCYLAYRRPRCHSPAEHIRPLRCLLPQLLPSTATCFHCNSCCRCISFCRRYFLPLLLLGVQEAEMSFPCGAHQATALSTALLLTSTATCFHCNSCCSFVSFCAAVFYHRC